MSQNLDERFSRLSLQGEKVTRSKHSSLSRSKSSSLEKILARRESNNIYTTTNTTNTLDNEIIEKNDDTPFPFINSFENRSRSFSSSTSSSTTILERISLRNLNGGVNSRSRSSLNSLDNSPKFTTPVGSTKETHDSYSQKPFLMTQLSQVPDIFNAPQMDFEEMAPFPELFRSSSNRSSLSKSRSRVHHSSSSNVISNHSGSIRSNGSSSNSLLNKSNSLNNNNNNFNPMGSYSSNGSIVNIAPTNSIHGGNNNSKSYSSVIINLVGNNTSSLFNKRVKCSLNNSVSTLFSDSKSYSPFSSFGVFSLSTK